MKKTQKKHKSLTKKAIEEKYASRKAYKIIEAFCEKHEGEWLTGSVYKIPIEGNDPFACAKKLWIALANETRGHIADGDIFYMHYPTSSKMIGTLFECASGASLSTDVDRALLDVLS